MFTTVIIISNSAANKELYNINSHVHKYILFNLISDICTNTRVRSKGKQPLGEAVPRDPETGVGRIRRSLQEYDTRIQVSGPSVYQERDCDTLYSWL